MISRDQLPFFLFHGTIISICAFLFYLANPGSSFFSWHPFLMTLSMLLLVIEAAVMFSPYWSLIPKKYHKQWYLDIHGYMQVCTFTAFAIGFWVIYTNKDRSGNPHFTSYHGIFGLIQAGIVIIPVINGTVVKYAKFLPVKLDVAKVKAIHSLMGVIAISFATLNMVSGFFTNWFIYQTSFVIPYFLSFLLFLINGFVVLRTFRTNSRIPTLFRKNKDK